MGKLKNFRIMYIIFMGILIICISFLSVIMIGSGYSRIRLKNEVINNIDSRSAFFSNEVSRQIDMIFLEQTNLVNDSSLKNISVLWDAMNRYEQIESVSGLSERLIQLKLLHTLVSDVNVFFLNQEMAVGSSRVWEGRESFSELVYDERIRVDADGITLTSWFPSAVYGEDANISYFIQTRLGTEKLEEYLNEFIREEEGWLCLLTPEGEYLAGAGAETGEELAELEQMRRQAQSLLDGGWAINAINQGLDSMDVLLREAVKGNYYGVSSGDFYQMQEKQPASDHRISSARSYVKSEMDAIKRDIEEEEERRRRERERDD